MTLNSETPLDATDHKLIAALQADGRLSFNALARQIGLSQPAVAERVRRLEKAGIIAAYRAVVDRAQGGLPLTAFLRLTCRGDRYQAVWRMARELPQVLECHHMTGRDCFLVKIAASTMAEIEQLIDRFRAQGETESALVLSSVVEDKPPWLPGRGR
jgi:Lrp/AsnC family leucine-responsive transcriptional regulator